jgi:hypothetical protein
MAGDFELHLQRSLDESYEAVVKVLKAGSQAWLPEFAQEAETMTAELAFDQAAQHVRRRVAIELGTIQLFAYGMTVRIQWRAARRPHLYPELEGHLRLDRRQPDGCFQSADIFICSRRPRSHNGSKVIYDTTTRAQRRWNHKALQSRW